MATKKLTDDIYVFTFYEPESNNLSMAIAQSLEEFQEYQETLKVIAWGNITGKDMEITQFYANTELSFVDSAEQME